MPTHLAAEVAEILGVLANLHLLDNLPETRAIASPVLAHDADLLCSLRLDRARDTTGTTVVVEASQREM